MNRKALVVFENTFKKCPRAARICECLRRIDFDVKLASLEEGEGNLTLTPLSARTLISRLTNHLSRYVGVINYAWRKKKESLFQSYLSGSKFDVIFVHSVDLLEIVIKFKGQAKVIFDAREYYPDQFSDRLFNRLFRVRKYHRICTEVVPKCDVVLTVSEGLIDLYEKNYGFRAVLFLSLPLYQSHDEHGEMEAICGVRPMRFVHHGNVARSRGLCNMIDVFDRLGEEFELDLMLTKSNPRHYDEIAKRVLDSENVRIVDAVDPDLIVNTISAYDLGLIMFSPINLNLKHCMPNKLFEMIQARLPIVSTPLPDIARFIEENNVGFVANGYDADSVEELLRGLTDDVIFAAKRQTDAIAKLYSLDANVEVISDVLFRRLEVL